VPFAHTPHAVAPTVLAGYEYFPAPQTSHVLFLPNIVEYLPSSHRLQSRSVVLEQALHPGIRLYFPAPHMIQGPPAETRTTRSY
jgi:hypothetical protein